MSKFLALITVAAMALFIAGPAMAQVVVNKSVDNSNTADTTFSTDIDVNKDIDIDVSGDLDATGGINVSGDSVFKELDVNVQDQENVVKFFELDDSASSTWTIIGTGVMNAAEQLQNGVGNLADISQNPFDPAEPWKQGAPQMNVGLQYQVGDLNTAFITQASAATQANKTSPTNNFAKQIQIGDGNLATINQN